MKKYLFLLVYCIMWTGICFAQSLGEKAALSVPRTYEQDMSQLSRYLVRGGRNKYDQAKAIAVWIASHIAYDNYTFAANAGKGSGYQSSSQLKGGAQTANEVFKTRIATCAGYADLYEKMLSSVGISSQKVHGYALYGVPSLIEAKRLIRQEKVGHVWNKVKLPTGDILVDITAMGQGSTGGTNTRLTPQMQRAELKKIKQEKPTYSYNTKHFDFSYKDMQADGEYRFDRDKKLIQR